MNAIVSITKLTKIYITDREKVEDCLHKIEIYSKHLLGMTNKVLDMQQIMIHLQPILITRIS